VQFGSAQLITPAGVSGFLRYSYSGQDAVVPLETRRATSYVVAFDNTNGASTGIAIANTDTSSATVPITVYDRTGAQIATDAVVLPAHGQVAYVLTDRTAVAANTAGSVQVSTPGRAISVLGVRYPVSGAFTTIPVVAP
jgi:hypothetical protein